jgi:hypothetical protein
MIKMGQGGGGPGDKEELAATKKLMGMLEKKVGGIELEVH